MGKIMKKHTALKQNVKTTRSDIKALTLLADTTSSWQFIP